MKRLKDVLIVLVTVGWLVPAACGVRFLIIAVRQLEVAPEAVNSFPFTQAAQDLLALSGMWLVLVVCTWTWLALARRR